MQFNFNLKFAKPQLENLNFEQLYFSLFSWVILHLAGGHMRSKICGVFTTSRWSHVQNMWHFYNWQVATCGPKYAVFFTTGRWSHAVQNMRRFYNWQVVTCPKYAAF